MTAAKIVKLVITTRQRKKYNFLAQQRSSRKNPF